jgi:RHS repeat-associated protein
MRFLFLLLFALQLSAHTFCVHTCRETSPNGFWLEAHAADDHRLLSINFSDGSSIRYDYSNARLSKITRLSPDGAELYSQTYHWDDRKLLGHTGFFTTQYLYDDLNRIVARIDPWNHTHIEYDNTVRIGNCTYTHDALGQITSEEGRFTATYDDNCNLTSLNNTPLCVDDENRILRLPYDESGNCLKDTFLYNDRNQLISANGETYLYDEIGRRIQKDSTTYLYLGFDEIASFEDGRLKTLKVPALGGPLAIEIEGKPFAPVTDPCGIIRKLIDPSTNTLIAENGCDIFGGNLTDAIPYAYRGKRYDPASNLIYFGLRYYDPSFHRFLTPDPLGPIDHPNLYQYVLNNPLLYCDPTGGSFLGYLSGLSEIALGGAIMLAGGIIEVGSLGVLTVGVGFAEVSGFTLIMDGLARTNRESRDSEWTTRPQPPTDSMPYIPYYNEPDFLDWLSKQGSIDPTLPVNPDDLLKRPGWKETTHPNGGAKGHRTFENTETGETLRHDQGRSGGTGHEKRDHYHRLNPATTGKHDLYLDKDFNPVPKNHEKSHLYPPP